MAYEPVNDQDLRGAYVSWKLTRQCGDALAAWCKKVGIVQPCDARDFHCTIMHSPERALDPMLHGDHPLPRPWHLGGYVVPASNPRAYDVLGPKDGPGALVVLMDAMAMHARNRHYRDEHLLRSNFPQYLPHLSLSYDFSAQNARTMLDVVRSPLPFPLHFDTEHVDWCDKPGE